jgi:glyoxylase-like metal-dependent hydrolase (beta-lactamase superfamily II)
MEKGRAGIALVSCPTASIGSALRGDFGAAAALLPETILDGVAHCGFADEGTFGAASYFVEAASGNVLVDSPRPTGRLLRRLEERGGVARHLLTHRDDVGAHGLLHERFSCERVLHRADLSADTRAVERVLEGSDVVALAPDLLAIPVPGHTPGSVAYLYDGRVLFSGDHLFATEEGDHLDASREVCWYSWKAQTRSMRALLEFDFEWVLPGHGRRFHATKGRMRDELAGLVRRMEAS